MEIYVENLRLKENLHEMYVRKLSSPASSGRRVGSGAQINGSAFEMKKSVGVCCINGRELGTGKLEFVGSELEAGTNGEVSVDDRLVSAGCGAIACPTCWSE